MILGREIMLRSERIREENLEWGLWLKRCREAGVESRRRRNLPETSPCSEIGAEVDLL